MGVSGLIQHSRKEGSLLSLRVKTWWLFKTISLLSIIFTDFEAALVFLLEWEMPQPERKAAILLLTAVSEADVTRKLVRRLPRKVGQNMVYVLMWKNVISIFSKYFKTFPQIKRCVVVLFFFSLSLPPSCGKIEIRKNGEKGYSQRRCLGVPPNFHHGGSPYYCFQWGARWKRGSGQLLQAALGVEAGGDVSFGIAAAAGPAQTFPPAEGGWWFGSGRQLAELHLSNHFVSCMLPSSHQVTLN